MARDKSRQVVYGKTEKAVMERARARDSRMELNSDIEDVLEVRDTVDEKEFVFNSPRSVRHVLEQIDEDKGMVDSNGCHDHMAVSSKWQSKLT